MQIHLVIATVAAALLAVLTFSSQTPPANAPSPRRDGAGANDLFTVPMRTLEGEPTTLAPHRGKVLLIVNVASKCGYTPQYAELERLHQRFKDRGLVILGFPSNDFGGQEPGTSQEIRDFCTRQYSVTFPMMEKVRTRPGEGRSELYRILESRTGKSPSWNFCKYLVGRDGATTSFYASSVKPESEELVKAIEAALASTAPAPSTPDAGARPPAPPGPHAPGSPGAPDV